MRARNDRKSGTDPRFSRKKFAMFASVPVLVLAGLVYAGSLIYRAHPLYARLKKPSHGTQDPLHKRHDTLGSVPISNIESAQLFPHGEPMPLRHDAHGFRIPISPLPEKSSEQTIMFLGCSHTYGQGVPAKETFAYLTAEALNARCMNAGVCGWGLAQIWGRAEELIPQFKPDIIVVQYSPWLTDRAVIRFAPNFFQRLPVPFFSNSAGELVLNSPVFGYAESGFGDFRLSAAGGGDFLRFLFNAGPTLFHDDAQMLSYHLRRWAGRIPQIETDRRAIEAATYSRIAEIARANDAQMIVLVLGWQLMRVPLPVDVVPAGIPIVQGHDAMIEALPSDTPVSLSLLYGRHYFQFRGDPPEVVDSGHPNDRAHAVIADALVSAIQAE
jgi:hypothetical protein